ncbi:MAG: hypothetical protein VKP72_01075 [bacterium]|nr:hypothetical protein [bacterium]
MIHKNWRSLVSSVALAVVCIAEPALAQVKGQLAPAFELPDLTGKVKRVDAARDHRGKLIVFFTSW